MRPPRVLLAAPLVVLALTGCSADDTSAQGPSGTGEGGADLTPRALAWLASERFGTPDSAEAGDDLEELGESVVGTELSYGSSGEDDGDSVTVAVARKLPPDLTDCDAPDNDYLSGCEEVADGVVLAWEEAVPEEDPGVVYVLVSKAGAGVVVFQSSEPVTGDPREIDLTVSVDDMVALAQDDRVALTTTQEAVDEGERIDWWA